MKAGDLIKVKVVSGGSQFFDYLGVYEAEIVEVCEDGNHHIWVADKYNEVFRSKMKNACHLNGGEFKILMEIVK